MGDQEFAMGRVALFSILGMILLLLVSGGLERVVGRSSAAKPANWLTGNRDEQIQTLAGQLRGLDVAMIEMGHRYAELFWAGKDGNWDFARYQAQKLRTSMEQALKRRPKRAHSAQAFLHVSLPRIEASIGERDSAHFLEEFHHLTVSCNACHAQEGMAFAHISIPDVRPSPVRFQPIPAYSSRP